MCNENGEIKGTEKIISNENGEIKNTFESLMEIGIRNVKERNRKVNERYVNEG